MIESNQNSSLGIWQVVLIGHLTLTLPSILIIGGLPILAVILNEGYLAKALMGLLATVVSTALAWLYWSLVVTHWRIYAFKHVDSDNWVRLRDQAVSHKLIWPSGSDFETTELRSIRSQRFLTEVENRIVELEQVQQVHLDFALPRSGIYEYDRVSIALEIIGKAMFLVASYFAFREVSYWLIVPSIALILLYGDGLRVLQRLVQSSDPLVINPEGMYQSLVKPHAILWSTITKLDLTDVPHRLVVTYEDEVGREDSLTIDVWRYKIPNIDLFKQHIEVFLHRSLYGVIE